MTWNGKVMNMKIKGGVDFGFRIELDLERKRPYKPENNVDEIHFCEDFKCLK